MRSRAVRFTHTVPVLRQILLVLAGGGLACLWSVDAGYGQTVNRELANPQSPKQQLADSHLSDSSDAARSEWSLNEGWKIHAADRTVDAALGVNWEAWLGPDFDGRATYVRNLDIPDSWRGDAGVRDSGRWLLEFDGAATEAEVALGGKRLGRHLGGWTPFRFDITDWVQQTCAESEDLESAKSSRTLTVELD